MVGSQQLSSAQNCTTNDRLSTLDDVKTPLTAAGRYDFLDDVALESSVIIHASCIIREHNVLHCTRGTGIRGLMRGMATLPQGNQELLVVRDKVVRPQVSLG